jgi:phytoene synthase
VTTTALVRQQASAVMTTHARTFSAAAAFLAPDAREEVAVLYAVCRKIDDLADEDGDAAALDRIRADLDRRASDDPLIAAFLAMADQRGVPLDALVHLVDGARSDLGRVRIADGAELVRYGYRVAGTVGRLVCPLLGVADPAAERFAVDLGIGMQLSNIARDVGEDADRDRVYLPGDWLRAEGVDPDDLRGADPAAVMRVVARVVDLAERYYESAAIGYRYLPFRARSVVVIAARRYRAIGRQVVARGPVALTDRTVVGKLPALAWTIAAPWIAVASGFSSPVPHETALHAPLEGLLA